MLAGVSRQRCREGSLPVTRAIVDELEVTLPEVARDLRAVSEAPAWLHGVERTLPHEKQRMGMIILLQRRVPCVARA